MYAGKKQKHAGFFGKDSILFPFLPTFFFKNNDFQAYFSANYRLFFVFLGRKWLLQREKLSLFLKSRVTENPFFLTKSFKSSI